MTKTTKTPAKTVEKAAQEVEQAVKKEISTHVEPEIIEGFEEMTADSFTIPFLNIAQSLTPALKEKSKDSLLKEGDIFDSASLEIFQKVKVIPVLFRRRFLEWKPRAMGGGFAGIHTEQPAEAVRAEKGLVLPNGNLINDTRQHYVLYEDANGMWTPALVTFKSTGIKVSQTWCLQMARARDIVTSQEGNTSFHRLNMYDRTYELTTRLRHDKGYSWFEYVIKGLPDKTGGLALQEAKEFYKSLKLDKVNLTASYADADAESGVNEEDVPY